MAGRGFSFVMARLDRAIGISTMNELMARSSRAMTVKRRCDDLCLTMLAPMGLVPAIHVFVGTTA